MEALLILSGLLKAAQVVQDMILKSNQQGKPLPTEDEVRAELAAAKERDANWRNEWAALMPEGKQDATPEQPANGD